MTETPERKIWREKKIEPPDKFVGYKITLTFEDYFSKRRVSETYSFEDAAKVKKFCDNLDFNSVEVLKEIEKYRDVQGCEFDHYEIVEFCENGDKYVVHVTNEDCATSHGYLGLAETEQ